MANETKKIEDDQTPGQGGGQGVDMSIDKNELVYGQGGGLSIDKGGLERELSIDKKELVYGQTDYLSMDKASKHSGLSEKTLRRRIREVLISSGLSWKSSPDEIAQGLRKIRKTNVKKNILGLVSFDWEISSKWLDEIKNKTAPVHRQGVDKAEDLSIDREEPAPQNAAFMVQGPLGNVQVKDAESIEINGRKYTKEHLEDILENYKEEKETKKTMMELQKQINVVMAQMGQIQKMMLLKSPKDDNE